VGVCGCLCVCVFVCGCLGVCVCVCVCVCVFVCVCTYEWTYLASWKEWSMVSARAGFGPSNMPFNSVSTRSLLTYINAYTCTCICICACVCTCIYIRTWICMCVYLRVCMRVIMCVYVFVIVYMYLSVLAPCPPVSICIPMSCVCICLCTCIHICILASFVLAPCSPVSMWTQVYVSACLHVNVQVYVYVQAYARWVRPSGHLSDSVSKEPYTAELYKSRYFGSFANDICFSTHCNTATHCNTQLHCNTVSKVQKTLAHVSSPPRQKSGSFAKCVLQKSSTKVDLYCKRHFVSSQLIPANPHAFEVVIDKNTHGVTTTSRVHRMLVLFRTRFLSCTALLHKRPRNLGSPIIIAPQHMHLK